MGVKGFNVGGRVLKYEYGQLEGKPNLLTLDATLTQQGKAADAEATGNAIQDVQSDVDINSDRIDNLVTSSTDNLSGFSISSQKVTVSRSAVDDEYYVTYNFTVPENVIILYAGYRGHGVDSLPYFTDDLRFGYYNSTTVQVIVNVTNHPSLLGDYDIIIVYAVSQSVSIPELTDLRIGADGVTYNTAGTAVRTQIENLTTLRVNVTATVNPSDSTMTNIVSDKAYAQILDAFNNNKPVELILNNINVLRITSVNNNSISFTHYVPNDPVDVSSFMYIYVGFHSDGTINGIFYDT